MTQDEEVTRGDRAKELINSELFVEAKEKLELAVIGQLRRVAVKGETATVAQQQLILMLQMQDMFIQHFETIIETGMLARDKNLGSS